MRPINYPALQHTCLNELKGKLQITEKNCEKLQLFDAFFIQLCRNISKPNQLPKSKAMHHQNQDYSTMYPAMDPMGI